MLPARRLVSRTPAHLCSHQLRCKLSESPLCVLPDLGMPAGRVVTIPFNLIFPQMKMQKKKVISMTIKFNSERFDDSSWKQWLFCSGEGAFPFYSRIRSGV